MEAAELVAVFGREDALRVEVEDAGDDGATMRCGDAGAGRTL